MKNFITKVLTIAVMLLATICHCHADDITVTRHYDPDMMTFKEITAADGRSYTQISYTGLISKDEPGSQDLPVENFRVQVPTNCNNLTVSVVGNSPVYSRSLDNRVYPIQPIMENNGQILSFIEPNEQNYSIITTPYAQILDEGFIMGNMHVVTISICPFSYEDDSRNLTLYSDVSVRITYDLCEESDMSQKPIHPQTQSTQMHAMGASTMENNSTSRQSLSSASDALSIMRYYIIVPDNLKEAVEQLAIWKRQKGYKVYVVTVESILTTATYRVGGTFTIGGNTHKIVDSAASLRAYLQDEFAQNGTFYCLLVGDATTSMPIRKVRKDSNELLWNKNENNLIPTDAYFSDLTQVWNLTSQCNGEIYTELYSGKSYNPDIIIGRLPCGNPEQIANYIRKLILYEANPGLGDNLYLSKATAFMSEDIAQYSSSYIAINNWMTIFNTDFIQDAPPIGNPTGKRIIDSISKSGFSSWNGHGVPYGVEVDNYKGYITSLDAIEGLESSEGTYPYSECTIPATVIKESGNGLDCLTNRYKPGVVYSMSCDNMPYDSLTWKMNDGSLWFFEPHMNLGEVYLTSDNIGGIAFLGNTRVGYIGSSSRLENFFITEIQNCQKLGNAETLSKTNANTYHYLRYAHNLAGDPETEMWLTSPVSMDFGEVAWNGSTIPTKLKDWNITLSDGYRKYMDIRDASYSTSLSTLTNKDFVASAWKTGYLPFIHYYGKNTSLGAVTKKMLVRTATLGCNMAMEPLSSYYRIGKRALIQISALDYIRSSNMFEILNGGTAILDCLQEINLNGVTVKEGGTLNVSGSHVKLGSHTRFEKGSSVQITTKKQPK